MNKEIRDKRTKLLLESKILRRLSNETNDDISFAIREQQNKTYNKWKFYDNLIKKMEQK